MASTTSASSDSHAYILDLPTELLQKIADECTGETLVQLRQTCKTMEGATLDLFADHYLHRLECFILDAARLLRVKNIISTPHLATRVRDVVFSLSAHESKYDIQLASNEGEERISSIAAAADTTAKVQCDRHACEIEFVSPTCWKLIRNIISLTHEVVSCGIAINLEAEESVRKNMVANHPVLAKEILTALVQEGGRVRDLVLSYACNLHAAHFEQGGIFREILQELRYFCYFVEAKTETDLVSTRSKQHWCILTAVLNDATSLDQLQITAMRGSEEVWNGSVLSGLCAQAFASPRLVALADLSLEGINILIHTLVRLVQSCAATLDTIQLGGLGLVGDDDPCGKLFRSLKAMPRLNFITIHNLVVRATDNAVFYEEGFHKASFLLPGKATDQRFEDTPNCEATDAKPFLELNIKHGIQYT